MMGWIYAATILAACVSTVMAYQKGYENAETAMSNTQMERRLTAIQARDETLNLVAESIKSIKIENRTIVQKFKEIERENTVYAECNHSPDAVRLLNSALAGGGVSAKPDLPGFVPK